MKLITTIVFLLGLVTLSCQSVILLEQDSVSQINENIDLSEQFVEFPLDLFYKNNTNSSILVNWRREFGDNCPLEWDVYSADQILSYVPQVDESQQPILMSPTDSNFIIRQAFIPRGVEGCCDLKMIFSLEDAPDSPIDTGYYHIEINANGCIETSVVEEDKSRISFYPNPSSKFINFENHTSIVAVEIFNVSGKRVYRNVHFDSSNIDISFLPNGIYMCRIKDREGTFFTEKVFKR